MSDAIDPNAAIDFMVSKSRAYAQAKADRAYLEQFRKSKKALLMNECTEKAIGAREQFAYAHPEYQQVLEGIREAICLEESLRWRLEAARLRVEVWRSQEASNRTMDKTVR